MELSLKKTKLTNSILNQTVIATLDELKVLFYPIGWCIQKNLKWVVLYNDNTSELRKLLMPKDIWSEVNYGQSKVKIRFEGNVNILTYNVGSDEERDMCMEVFKYIKDSSNLKGQFFL
jgi:hypothetical protein